jgi:hypothetical protein
MENGVSNGLDAPALPIKVRVGAKEYEPRWSLLSQYALSARSLTLQEIFDEINSNGPRGMALVVELLRAMIVHHFKNGPVPTAASLVAEMSTEQYMQVYPALQAAGQRDGAFVITPKNAQKPVEEPAKVPETGNPPIQ